MAVRKWEPFGDELSPEVALLQSAQALDIAARIAFKKDDADALTAIGAVWVDVARSMVIEAPEPKIVDAEGEQVPFGFNCGVKGVDDDREES
jgi:hypothetical protein